MRKPVKKRVKIKFGTRTNWHEPKPPTLPKAPWDKPKDKEKVAQK